MRRFILNALLIPVLAILPALTLAVPAYAVCGSSSAQQVANGVGETGTDACNGTDKGVNKAIALVVNLLSMIIGIAAIIVIIISGFKYITSGGDASKVGNAKNTLLYAIIGIAVAALAEFIVHFVLNRAGTL